jgi:Ulp1 family protease
VNSGDTLFYKNVSTRANKVPGGKIFNLDHLFFPMHQCHWILGYVDVKKKLIYYYDSLFPTDKMDGQNFQKKIHKYLRAEHISVTKKDLTAEWCFVDVGHTKGPKQMAGHNCGPHIAMMVDAICTLGVPPEVLFLFGDWNTSSEDMDRYRYRMGHLILKAELPTIQDLPTKIDSDKELTSSPYHN